MSGSPYDQYITRTPKEWDAEEGDLTDEEIAELAGEAKYESQRDDAMTED